MLRSDVPPIEEIKAAFDKEWSEQQNRIEEAQKIISEALQLQQEILSSVAYDVAGAYNHQRALLKYLYWERPDIKQTWISKAFSLKNNEVLKIVGPCDVELKCADCQTPLAEKATSRTKLEELYTRNRNPNQWSGFRCMECKAKRDQEYKAHAEERAMRQADLEAMPLKEYLNTPEVYDWLMYEFMERQAGCAVCDSKATHFYFRDENSFRKDRQVFFTCKTCLIAITPTLPDTASALEFSTTFMADWEIRCRNEDSRDY